ncbi:PREDICTED: DNA polymerase delta subunit 4 isoform X2 [Condylura cristata]|uniref:DNA polymerase delta subunit 4 isoform X2 n=1 Tax=Condylura cristata TaxID=143302 RepID=UPI000642E93C|nr:PREDICTED: DNA polymerase delta subunit 4 isoform X2 [Condylura cristata]
MGRKRLITDSYPVVKRREDPTGHSKGELVPELGLGGGCAASAAEGHDRARADVGALGEVRPGGCFLARLAEGPGVATVNCEAGGAPPARPEEQLVFAGEEPQPLSADVDEAALELLRQFDLARQYGPCTGITRLQRWHRAQKMGLEPPLEVRQLLQAHLEDPRYQHSLWHLYPL